MTSGKLYHLPYPGDIRFDGLKHDIWCLPRELHRPHVRLEGGVRRGEPHVAEGHARRGGGVLQEVDPRCDLTRGPDEEEKNTLGIKPAGKSLLRCMKKAFSNAF